MQEKKGRAVYFFSRTGTSQKIAIFLAKKLKIPLREIKSFPLPYVLWLLLSFFPHLKVKSFFETPEEEEIILCFPKWTFNCPPITYFLKKFQCKRLFLIISYGGWGEKWYAKHYKKMALKCAGEVKVKCVKRKKVEKNFSEISREILEFLS